MAETPQQRAETLRKALHRKEQDNKKMREALRAMEQMIAKALTTDPSNKEATQ